MRQQKENNDVQKQDICISARFVSGDNKQYVFVTRESHFFSTGRSEVRVSYRAWSMNGFTGFDLYQGQLSVKDMANKGTACRGLKACRLEPATPLHIRLSTVNSP